MIMKNSSALDQLFANNREWAEAKIAKDADFFKRLVSQQAPEYLWIGCSDSRVPANEIVNLLPGELFVHRNVANVVVHTDLNCLSVIQFAIDLLKVKHILVVGHYGCSGVHAALADKRIGLADNWLRHVKDVHQKHGRYLGDSIPTPKRQDRLCELNVIEQVVNVCETTIVQDAWSRGQDLTVHGWAYRLETGLVNDLGMSISSTEEMNLRYAKSLSRYDVE
ncbi:carbonate dehydratase [Polynucleobacter aenigmaticus]|uniref:Carbonic anhydrase 2 n=1 Tax=Polynucleobacter aenigmaticus TaxID=1743164 RepID=A0A254QC72_9BURK|nr:carbonate dehydratase [Polynucleobacter aenigmaticus]OWS72487.1 carbonate dehydratase [Polynucleobacter aenigmaticus]